MGGHRVGEGGDDAGVCAFTRALLDDPAALERMLDGGRIESGVRRIEVEQEMFLVDRHMRPALVAEEVLSRGGRD